MHALHKVIKYFWWCKTKAGYQQSLAELYFSKAFPDDPEKKINLIFELFFDCNSSGNTKNGSSVVPKIRNNVILSISYQD